MNTDSDFSIGADDEESVVQDRRHIPFFQVDNIAVDVYLPHIGCTALAVYVLLVRTAGRKDDCFLSLRRMRIVTGESESTVRRALSVLFKADMIRIDPRYRRDGSQSSNLYTLLDLSPDGPKLLQQPLARLTGGGVTSDRGGCHHRYPYRSRLL